MPGLYTEADYENSVIELFRNMGYSYLYGPDIERDFHNPLYEEELVASLNRLNRSQPEDAISDALFKLKNFENGELVQKNTVFMDYLQNGIPVRYFEKGEERSSIVYLVDYKNPDNNSFIVANQWTFIENSNKRPDILLFLNGIPVVIVELKSPSREETDASAAYRQLRNYMKEIPSMFIYNAICVMSDQMTSKAGTITSGEDRFMEWKTVDGSYENTQYAQFDTFFEGMFQKERLLDLIKNFICFSNEGVNSFKILAGYHQYFAVRKAIESTKRATVTDGKGGVFWHTQGSGKSLSMVFYAHLLQEALDSPTIVVLTDRNDLDDQLFGQFAKCKDFLRQEPVHATCRKLTEISSKNDVGLKDWLEGRQANGIIFTTMQKFEESNEALSERRNIIVMADEAHRGQYGLTEKIKMTKNEDGEEIAKRVVGTARIIRNSLPNATYIGFTGTPISSKDRSTREVFGDYIDIYDMTQAVEDGATRPVYYESRVIKLNLDEATLRMIDAEYEIMAHNADPEVIEKSKKTLGQMEAILGNDNTINSLVCDILDHYENYREGLLTGKAMIVAYSRPIAMKIYKRILELRPDWTEKVGIVMTGGNNDPEEWHDIIGNKRHKDELAKKFKDNNSPMKIAIVVDMWITGFDVPSLTYMYNDKPLKRHLLIQTISRVNRKYPGKDYGFIIDYIGIRDNMREALKIYGGDHSIAPTADDVQQATDVFREELSILKDLFSGYDLTPFLNPAGDPALRYRLLAKAAEYVFVSTQELQTEIKGGKDVRKVSFKTYFLKTVKRMRAAHDICQPSGELDEEESALAQCFMAIAGFVRKMNGTDTEVDTDTMNRHVAKMVEEALKYNEVENVLEDGEQEDIFSPEYYEKLSDVKMPASKLELLVKMLRKQIMEYGKTNQMAAKKYQEMLEETIKQYHERRKHLTAEEAGEAQEQTSEEIIRNATEQALRILREMNADRESFRKIGLTFEEKAFYDILMALRDEYNFEYGKDKIVDGISVNEKCSSLARKIKEIIDAKSSFADWLNNQNVRDQLKFDIKVCLIKNGYPPQYSPEVFRKVMEQVENIEEHSSISGM